MLLTTDISSLLSSLTLSDASSSASSSLSDNDSSTLQEYESSYATPPITWMEGNDTLSITGATLSGSQLTLEITVSMGTVPECVPMNLRFVADEAGTLVAPLTTQFSFPDSGTCEGTPGATYPDQEIVFTVDPVTLPLLFNTGGTSNAYFELSTNASSGIDITLPPTSG